MDLKAAGNRLYLVGVTKPELGGSHYHLVTGQTGGAVPKVDLDLAPRVFTGVHAAITKVRDAIGRNDLAAVKAATAELETAANAMTQHLYSRAGQPGPGGPTASPGGADKKGGDDVIDAEYEVKK